VSRETDWPLGSRYQGRSVRPGGAAFFANHPLRPIRTWVNDALAGMNAKLSAIVQRTLDPSARFLPRSRGRVKRR